MIDKAKLLAILHSARTRMYCKRGLITLLIIGLLGFVVLPPIVKSVLLDKLSIALQRPVSLQRVSINPYALSLTLEGLKIGERVKDSDNAAPGVKSEAKPFVAFDRLYLNLESTSLFRGGFVLGEIQLINPRISLIRYAEQRYNFSDLLDAALSAPPSEGPSPRFSLNNIQISGGSVEFDDQPFSEQHTLSDIQLALPFVSNMAYAVNSFVEPAFSAKVNGAPLALKGRSKIFADSLESEVAFDIDGLKLADFLDYSPVPLALKMRSGTFDSRLKLVFSQEKKQPATLTLSGGVDLRDLQLVDAEAKPLLGFKHLELKLTGADLLRQRFEIERFALHAPTVHARVDRQGNVNWLSVLSKAQGIDPGPQVPATKPAATAPTADKQRATDAERQSKPESKTAQTPSWSLAEAKVSGGSVEWYDESHGVPFNARVGEIDFSARSLHSEAGKPGEFDVSWQMLAGDWLKVDRFAIREAKLDLGARAVHLSEVEAKGAQALFRRLADGRVDWIKPPALRAAQASQQTASTPWALSIGKYAGEGIGLRFEDMTLKPVAVQTVDGLSFLLENVSTAPGERAAVSTRFKINRKGEVALKGGVVLQPLQADVAIDAKAVELLPLQPYFGQFLNVDVTRGQVTVGGDLKVADVSKGKGTSPDVSIGFSGNVTVGDFQAVDKLNSADFLRWKSFHFGKIDVQTAPQSLSIGDIALSDFFARVIVSPDGKLNLMQIVRREGEAPSEIVPSEAKPSPTASQSDDGKAVAPVAHERAPLMPMKIGKITLQGGTVRFSDNFIKPNYTANLRQIGGRVSGLSTEPGSVASLELRGSYDNIAPLNVTAKINPLAAKPYLDLQADVKGIEMTSFSSYSGKYAGYAIDKGKLSLFVNYKIENDQLAAENRLFIDQFTFGERVDSPDATNLPVNLAVSLLKNRNGEIDLNLPISGSLNDPQFSVGGLIVKVIVNLFAKALTSPFALLSAAFGGGEEFSSVDFVPGFARLDDAAIKRLESLAKAMVDRPAIKLEIEGNVVPDVDREGLKRALLEQRVRAVKREELTRKGVETESLDAIQISDKEYPILLERVYGAAKFPKPRNMVGLVKSLPVDEMEKLLLTNTVVGDQELRDLGTARASSVRDWLLERSVPAERIFTLPPRINEASADKTDRTADSKAGPKVVFGLK